MIAIIFYQDQDFSSIFSVCCDEALTSITCLVSQKRKIEPELNSVEEDWKKEERGESMMSDANGAQKSVGVGMRKQGGQNHPQLTQRNQEAMARAPPVVPAARRAVCSFPPLCPRTPYRCVFRWKRRKENRGSKIPIDGSRRRRRAGVPPDASTWGPEIYSPRIPAVGPMSGRLRCTHDGVNLSVTGQQREKIPILFILQQDPSGA